MSGCRARCAARTLWQFRPRFPTPWPPSAGSRYGEAMVLERDVAVSGGRTVRAYDTGGGDPGELTVVWHHGSPHTGALLPQLLSAASEHGIRLVTYARPSYGGSTPRSGRDVASAADDVAEVAAALGVGRLAVMGASGGGPHALACAALLADRVTAAVCLAGLAPFSQDEDWFAGMRSDGALRAAAAGREARARFAETAEFDPETFIGADWAALSGQWSSMADDVGRAAEAGGDELIDDDVAFVTPWGFNLTDIGAPVLVVHGGGDRMVPLRTPIGWSATSGALSSGTGPTTGTSRSCASCRPPWPGSRLSTDRKTGPASGRGGDLSGCRRAPAGDVGLRRERPVVSDGAAACRSTACAVVESVDQDRPWDQG